MLLTSVMLMRLMPMSYDRLSYNRPQSTVKSQHRRLQWVVFDVLGVLSLAWRLVITCFRRLGHVYNFVELGLRRHHVLAGRAPLAAGIVIGVVVAGLAAVCGVALYWWRKLTTGVAV